MKKNHREEGCLEGDLNLWTLRDTAENICPFTKSAVNFNFVLSIT